MGPSPHLKEERSHFSCNLPYGAVMAVECNRGLINIVQLEK